MALDFRHWRGRYQSMTGFADFDSIQVGDERRVEKVITEKDVRLFVEMTGDSNPLHLDADFAVQTPFKEVVVHGMLGASLISTVIGTRLPGPGALWISQDVEFLLPVRLGDTLVVSGKVKAKHERDKLLDLETKITNQYGQVVLKGTGRVKVLESARSAPVIQDSNTLSRVAIVTGGAGGIGSAICLRLALDGFSVIIGFHRNQKSAENIVELIQTQGGKAHAVRGDISSTSAASELVSTAEAIFGPVGILVNNASPRINPKSVMDVGWDDVQNQLDVQVRGAMLLTQQCLPGMTERKHGRIINITSQINYGTPVPRWTAYAVAKAALSAFSRQMAAELGPSGITVNCVAPGMTQTAFIGDVPLKAQLIAARQTPLRRLAQPHDVAAAISFLASDDARFITGQTLNVNGGVEMS